MPELKPDPVYQRVQEGLRQLGVSNLVSITRRFLLKNGMFCGCRFRCGDVEAFWWLDTDRIEYQDSSGNRLSSADEPPELKKAA